MEKAQLQSNSKSSDSVVAALRVAVHSSIVLPSNLDFQCEHCVHLMPGCTCLVGMLSFPHTGRNLRD